MMTKLLTCCAALLGLFAFDNSASAYFWYTTAPRCTSQADCGSGLTCMEMHDSLKFCLTTCSGDGECGGQICHHGGCVTPTRWFRTELTVKVSTTVPQEVAWDVMEPLVHQAYDAWVDLPGCNVPQVDVVGTTASTAITTPTTLAEEPDNIVVFIKDSQRWRDIPGATNTQIALTIIAHNPETGEIADADIAVNDAAFAFTTEDDATAGVDLLSALTHEAGHFFGLAHSKDVDATMAPGYGSDLSRRIQ
ncbi:MAG: matrixin family metalloprotease, partial [Myxococcales bacterium]|nr:matrixin family metalloprotease [Myxococcales bacterium]